jgi:hypothetical protein
VTTGKQDAWLGTAAGVFAATLLIASATLGGYFYEHEVKYIVFGAIAFLLSFEFFRLKQYAWTVWVALVSAIALYFVFGMMVASPENWLFAGRNAVGVLIFLAVLVESYWRLYLRFFMSRDSEE